MEPSKASQRGPVGVEGELTEAGSKVAEEYFHTVRYLALPFKWKYPSWEDEIESAAMLAVIYAIGSFEEEREVPLGAWVAMKVRFAILQTIRSNLKRASRTEQLDLADWHLLPSAGLAEEVAVDNQDFFEVELATLPSEQAEMVRMLLEEGLTFREAGERLGISPQGARRRYLEGISALKRSNGAGT